MRALALALGTSLVLCGSHAGAQTESVRVALLPIAVHSAEPDSGYLSAGLADMLSARLEQSGRVAVVRLTGTPPGTNEVAAVSAGEAAGAEYVLYGSFTQFGSGASLDVRCSQVGGDSGGPRQVFIQSGSLGEIIPRLDEMAEKVNRYVIEGPAVQAEVPVVAETNGNATASIPEPPIDYGELLRRVEALERAVYVAEEGPAAPAVTDLEEEGVDAPPPAEIAPPAANAVPAEATQTAENPPPVR